MNDNWVISNLENALGTWNEKLSELWQLVTQTPETFKGGQIWSVIVSINSAFVGIGYGLLVLFFAMGIFQSAASFKELQSRSLPCGILSASQWQSWRWAAVWR